MLAFTTLILGIFVISSLSMPADLKENPLVDKSLQYNTTSCTITSYVLALQNMCGFESIHGLWPDPESTCTSCTSEVFSESKLSSSTLNSMKKYWPTCESGTNDAFWSHEWSKHGTCTGMTQDAYFSKGLSLFSSYSSNCSPSASTCNLCFTSAFKYTGKC